MKAERAHVTSSEAIERFRARFIVYRDKSKPLLADAADEVVRTREWLSERRRFWEAETGRRKRLLEDAQQALFSARFSNLREVKSAEQQAVHRAERALAEAEEKLMRVKRWVAGFDHQTGPLLKQVEQLRTSAAQSLTRGEEYLGRVIAALDRYAQAQAAPPAE
jgi:7-keto-8-aminopelargonate synthetase-like enzyme